jgi:uncharacterized protein YpmS
MKNKWKIAFFSLLVLVIIIPILLFQTLLPESNGFQEEEARSVERGGEPVFSIASTKQQLNFLIKDQLEQLKQGREDIDYTVMLTDEVVVDGYLTFFGRQVGFQMVFEPVVLENGNLLFREKVIRLGMLNLPGDKILEFIEGSTALPQWVNINSNEEEIMLSLTEIEFRDNMYVRAKSFNLEEDNIRFQVYYE